MRALLLALTLALAMPIMGAAPGWAVEPDEMLDDPVLEARARALSREIRCLVCQNEPIDSSNAGLARDLRILIRERMVAGDSDDDVKAFLVARYGDYVLLDPPMKLTTYALWFGPVLILLLGGIGVFVFFSGARRAPPATAPLSAEERARLDRLLDAETEREHPGGEET
ncbi:MAG: cytochrome c-type biogenesis protein [Alphaproteobacteria bacterium]